MLTDWCSLQAVEAEMRNLLAIPLTQTSPAMGVLLLVNRLSEDGVVDSEGFRPKDTQAIEIFMRQVPCRACGRLVVRVGR